MQTLTHISNTSIETAAVRGGTADNDTLWEPGVEGTRRNARLYPLMALCSTQYYFVTMVPQDLCCADELEGDHGQ